MYENMTPSIYFKTERLSHTDEEQSEQCFNEFLERAQQADEWSPQHPWVSAGASRMITSAPLSSHHHSAFHSALTFSLFVFIFFLIILPLLQTDSTSGPLLLAGYEDGSLLLWDVTQRSKVSSAKAHPEPVMCLTFDTKRLRGISGSSEKKLASWTLDRQQNLQVSTRVFFWGSGVVCSVKLL